VSIERQDALARDGVFSTSPTSFEPCDFSLMVSGALHSGDEARRVVVAQVLADARQRNASPRCRAIAAAGRAMPEPCRSCGEFTVPPLRITYLAARTSIGEPLRPPLR